VDVDRFALMTGDCRVLLPDLPSGIVDFVLTDPPYPCIKRDYGTWTEAEWFDLMKAVVPQVRRVLRPHGSAVFIVQPGSDGIGKMRPWVWDFGAWLCREWNLVQDFYWWNMAAWPIGGAPSGGLARPSIKYCFWAGLPDCYRNQDAVLWPESDGNKALRAEARFSGRTQYPSGHSRHEQRISGAGAIRFGVTPYNLLPFARASGESCGGSYGHGAATPVPLCEWWIRYCTRKGSLVLDPFSGSASVGVAALRLGRQYIGMEVKPEYNAIGSQRLQECVEKTPAIG
jgi:DNA modification methylase